MASIQRAFTVIVSGPNHLIGDNQQLAKFREGKARELPPWYGEWSDMLPHWHLAILESPADVGEFYRGAVREMHTPRVGFISNSKLSLSCGYEGGFERHDTPRAYGRDRALPESAAEIEKEHLTRIRKARNKTRSTQAEADAQATEETTDSEVPTRTFPIGVSERTERRDALLRQASITRFQDEHGQWQARIIAQPIPRCGMCCPHCGRRALDNKFFPLTLKKLLERGHSAMCEWCGERLNSMARERDNVQDREHPLWSSPDWQQHHYDADGNRSIPWGRRPSSNPRYALGLLIARRYRGLTDLYLSDEVHECKGDGSAIGPAFGAMVGAAHKSVGLTGTLFGGYAGDVYSLLCRLGNRPIIQKYGWDAKTRFVDDFGVVDEISKEIVRADEAGHFSGKPMHVVEKDELPGITAGLAMVLQNQSVSVLLKHMGFHLVNYTEDLITLDMPKDLAWEYEQLEEAGKGIIAWSGNDALSGYLQSTLSYPYQPWNPKTIHSAKKAASGKTSTYTPPAYAHDLVLPHHEWLAEYCAAQVRMGRRVLIYAEHTGTDDLMPDVQAKITRLAAEEHGTTLKVAILRSTTVPAGERKAWFAAREADGTNVVICNPKLVKTGLNLIGWPSIVVLEPVYSLYVLAQAKRRAFRPTQTRDCEVTFLCYEDTMSERAISIVARKAAAAAILNGDDLSGGLMEFDAGMSLLQELARMVTKGEADEQHADVRAMLAAGAAALKADLESGTAGLVGAIETLELPPMTLDLPVPAPTPVTAATVEVSPAKSRPEFGTMVPRKPTVRKKNLVTITGVSKDGQLSMLGDLFPIPSSSPGAGQLSLFG